MFSLEAVIHQDQVPVPQVLPLIRLLHRAVHRLAPIPIRAAGEMRPGEIIKK